MASDTHILVTGGAGFIGSHMVDALLEHGSRVTVLDKLTYAGTLANLEARQTDERFAFVRGDVTDLETVAPLVRDADRVVHAAAESHVDRSIDRSREFVVTNVLGTQTVLEACRATATPILFVNTDEVYGAGTVGTTFHEDDPLRPRNPYAASKAGADLLCRAYAETYGVIVTVVRGTNAFGPRQFPEKVIPVYTLAALDGRPLPVYGRGEQRREWLFVEDWVRACLVALDRGEPGGVYNIGSGTEIPNLELAARICALAGADPSLISFVDDRPGHDFRYGMDDARLRGLGWEPSVAFDDALATTVAWYAGHREWVSERLEGAGR